MPVEARDFSRVKRMEMILPLCRRLARSPAKRVSLDAQSYLTRRRRVTGMEPSGRGGTFQESSSPFKSYART